MTADGPSASATATSPSRPAVAGAFLLLIVFCALFCWRMFTGIPLLGDATQVFYPLMDHVARTLRQGLPAPWLDALAGGYYVHGAGQAALLYPVNWILYRLIPMPWAFSASYVLHLSLGACGFFCFLRRKALQPLSCVLGALLYAFNGHVAGHHIHLNALLTLAWLPWVLWASHSAFARPTLRSVAAFGLLYGVMVIAGHPQWLWLATLVLLTYALTGPNTAQTGPGATRRFLALAIAGILALMVGAGQLIPLTQTALHVDRSGGNALGHAGSYALTLGDVPRLLFPDLHGNPARGSCLVDPAYWWETAGFQGAAALCLAFAFLAGFRWSRTSWFAVVLIIVGFTLALGSVNPVYRLLVHLPLVGSFRGAARYLLLALIGVAVAAAEGHSRSLDGETPSRPTGLQSVAVGLPLVLLVVVVLSNFVFAGFQWVFSAPLHPQALQVPVQVRADAIRNYLVGWEPVVIVLCAVLTGIWLSLGLNARRALAALPILLVALELSLFWRAFVVTTSAEYYQVAPSALRPAVGAAAGGQWGRLLAVDAPQKWQGLDAMRAPLLEFLSPSWGLPTLQGTDTLQPWDAVNKRNRAIARLQTGEPERMAHGRQIADLYGVRWLVSERDLAPVGLKPMPGCPELWESPTALPFAYLATRVIAAPQAADQEMAVEDPRFVVGSDCAADPAVVGSAGGVPGRCKVLDARPGRVRARVQCPAPSVMVVQQNWHPDWRATVNGKPVACGRANDICIGVPIPASPGEVAVELRFHDESATAAALISVAAAVALIALLVAGRSTPAARR
jgi:hypothetical protein